MSHAPTESQPMTLKYKSVDDLELLMDVYLPPSDHSSTKPIPVPAVVFFHGGGLTIGSRLSWFPSWLQSRVNASGHIFISADYRLLPPSTGHDVLADIKDLFRFFGTKFNEELSANLQSANNVHRHSHPHLAPTLDASAIAVAGSSAGGTCAYLAAMHASPRPRAVVSLYGMGGNFLVPRYFVPKAPGTVFFRNREYLDSIPFSEYIHPASSKLPPISADEPVYHPETSPTPGYPAKLRMQLARFYIQQGVFLDYYTGCHDPSLSVALREAAAAPADSPLSGPGGVAALTSVIPVEQVHLFPQLGVTQGWPPTLLVHGEKDTAVPVQESQHMLELLQGAGVDVALKVVEGQEHSFDKQALAEGLYGKGGGLFDEVVRFLVGHLKAKKAEK